MSHQIINLFRKIDALISEIKEHVYEVAEDDAAPEAATDSAEAAIEFLLDVEMGLYEAQVRTLEALRAVAEAEEAA